MKLRLSDREQRYRQGRPRKGAWIEIKNSKAPASVIYGRPRKGAWIEIKG